MKKAKQNRSKTGEERGRNGQGKDEERTKKGRGKGEKSFKKRQGLRNNACASLLSGPHDDTYLKSLLFTSVIVGWSK